MSSQQLGMPDEAIKAYQKGISEAGRRPNFLAVLAYAYAASGRRAEAMKIRDELTTMAKEQDVSPYDLAILYTGLGEKDQALDQLSKALDERAGWIIYLKVEPLFDPLHSEPRFTDLVRRLGLPQ